MLNLRSCLIIMANRRLLAANPVIVNTARTLISKEKLGINNYKENRERTKLRTRDFDRKNIEMALRVSDVSALIGLTKRWLHLMDRDECEANFELLRDSLSHIYANSAKSNASFDFGPLVMRTLHYFDMPEKALQLNDDLYFGGMFQKLTCSLVLGDLLFENAMYRELLDDIQKRCDSQSKREKSTSRLVNYLTMAACYKLNTRQYLEYGLNVWKNAVKEHQIDHTPSFLAMLAVKQGEPEIALTVLPQDNERFSTANVRLIALAECGRFKEAGETISSILSIQERGFKISEETIKRVNSILQKNSTNKDALLCMDLLNEIRKRRTISSATLDALLCWTLSEKVDRHTWA